MTPLQATLSQVALALAEARSKWWVIGSAAVMLHGEDPGPVGDVDILLGVPDARRIFSVLGLPVAPGRADDLFRSALFARWIAPPVPVEFMAGLELCSDGNWAAVRPRTRVALGSVFAPGREEMVSILTRFGRKKDLRRAALLVYSAGRSIDQKRGPPPGTRHSPVTAKPSPW